MSVFETVVIVIGIVNVLLLILTFLMYTYLVSAKIHISQMHAGLASILGKVISLEAVTSKMGEGFTEVIALTEDMLGRLGMEQVGTVTKFIRPKMANIQQNHLMNY
jgi:hypothetical protein